jgi:hypothetical protein
MVPSPEQPGDLTNPDFLGAALHVSSWLAQKSFFPSKWHAYLVPFRSIFLVITAFMCMDDIMNEEREAN